MDGASHVTLHVWLQGDGASADLVNYPILDPNVDLVPPMAKRPDLIVKQIWHDIYGFTVSLGFNNTNPWYFWTISPGASTQEDWRFFAGIRDHSAAASGGFDSDGKLLISTQGLGQTTNAGAFVLWMEKRIFTNTQAL